MSKLNALVIKYPPQVGERLHGYVINDGLERFKQGELITTSNVVEVDQVVIGDTDLYEITTQSGTNYTAVLAKN